MTVEILMAIAQLCNQPNMSKEVSLKCQKQYIECFEHRRIRKIGTEADTLASCVKEKK